MSAAEDVSDHQCMVLHPLVEWLHRNRLFRSYSSQVPFRQGFAQLILIVTSTSGKLKVASLFFFPEKERGDTKCSLRTVFEMSTAFIAGKCFFLPFFFSLGVGGRGRGHLGFVCFKSSYIFSTFECLAY